MVQGRRSRSYSRSPSPSYSLTPSLSPSYYSPSLSPSYYSPSLSPSYSLSPYHNDRSLSPSYYPPSPYYRDGSYSRSPPPARIRSDNGNHSGASSSSKRSKTYHGGGDNGIDRISDMPDLVLHHILSFMNMREVIRNTSRISKRWENLWISLPILNFDHYSRIIGDERSFFRFVDRVLLRRDNSVIKSLRIFYRHPRNGSMRSIKDWMQYAARKNVEEVYLDFRFRSGDDENILMWPKLSKIQALKLHAGNNLQIPHSLLSDTQLKSLKLDSLRLPEGKVTLSCSVLENLTISYCDHYNITILNISSPKLNSLEIKNNHGSYNGTCKLQISTPNLTSLLLKGGMYKGYSLENLSSIVKAKFECYKVRDVDILRNILEGLHNATTLELCGEMQRNTTVRSLDMLDHHLLNTFVNLKCLKLIGWWGGSCRHTIHSLLMNSYSLEALVFEIDHVRKAHDWKELFPCIYRLKSFEVKGIIGCENELKLFEFILKNAVLLENFTIYSHKSIRHKGKEELAKFNTKLYSAPKASSSVKILPFY